MRVCVCVRVRARVFARAFALEWAHACDCCKYVHAVNRLELLVGLASFTSCLVAVDKLYLYYCTVFYKVMARADRELSI